MIIAVNALASTNLSGPSVLLGHLAQLAQWTAGKHEYVVLYHASNRHIRRDLGPNVQWLECPSFTARWLTRTLWEHAVLPGKLRDLKADMLFTASGAIVGSVTLPQVVLAMNPWCLVPEAQNGAGERLKALLQRSAYRKTVRKASMIAYLSRFLRDAYIANAGQEEEKKTTDYPPTPRLRRAGTDSTDWEAEEKNEEDHPRNTLNTRKYEGKEEELPAEHAERHGTGKKRRTTDYPPTPRLRRAGTDSTDWEAKEKNEEDHPRNTPNTRNGEREERNFAEDSSSSPSFHFRVLSRISRMISSSSPSSRSEIVYCGMDDDILAHADSPLPFERRKNQIISVSLMARHKNVETSVRALAMLGRKHGLRPALLLIGGWSDSGYKREMEKLVSREGVANQVTFTGHVAREDLFRYYAESQVFCLMSRCESFGIPAVEAQSFGTPVVAGNCCAPPEICGAGGIYPEPGDVEGTAEALGRLLSDKDTWNRYSEAALQNAAKYRYETCSRPLMRMFEVVSG